jgi:hypothetical protein
LINVEALTDNERANALAELAYYELVHTSVTSGVPILIIDKDDTFETAERYLGESVITKLYELIKEKNNAKQFIDGQVFE